MKDRVTGQGDGDSHCRSFNNDQTDRSLNKVDLNTQYEEKYSPQVTTTPGTAFVVLWI